MFRARVALLPVPRRLVVLAVHAAVALPGAPAVKSRVYISQDKPSGSLGAKTEGKVVSGRRSTSVASPVGQEDLHLVLGQVPRVALRQLAHQPQPTLVLVLGRDLKRCFVRTSRTSSKIRQCGAFGAMLPIVQHHLDCWYV